MADVTVKRTEDFEATFRGGDAQGPRRPRRDLVRHADPALSRRTPTLPRARSRRETARRRSTPCSRAPRRCTPATRSTRSSPACSPGSAPTRRRKLVTAEQPATILVLGGVPGEPYAVTEITEEGEPDPLRPATWLTSRSSASRTSRRSSAAASCASAPASASRSFGLAVMDLPPNFGDYPEHDQAHDHQEEVYTVLSGRRPCASGGEEHELEPGRLGPGRRRTRSARSSPATSGAGCSPSAARRAPPTWRRSSPTRARADPMASSRHDELESERLGG